MKLESYTFVLNDEKMLPFFLDYYTPIIDKMNFMDSGSTDNTINIIKSYGHKVTQTGLTFWDWDTMRNIYQNIWKSSNADYVFLMDVDEFFYYPNLRSFLEESKDNIDIYQMEGYQMVSNFFPKPNTNIFDINMGVRLPLYDKSTIFNPKIDIYHENAHEIVTTSKRICRRVVKLLHYKFLGKEVLIKRSELVKARVPKNSFCEYINGNILSVYPAFIKSEQQWQDEINQLLSNAEQVI
jgi:glycosyltransferase involved in cell wall biosynthesis